MEAIAQLERWRDRVSAPVPPVAVPDPLGIDGLLGNARSLADDTADAVRNLGLDESALFATRVEELSRTVEYLQIVAAGQLDRLRTHAARPAAAPAGWTTGWHATTALPDDGTTGGAQQAGGAQQPGAARQASARGTGAGQSGATAGADTARAGLAAEFRTSTEYLRVLLRISAAEARRRLALAATTLPRHTITGQPAEPAHGHLAAALAAGTISTRSATIIALTLDKAPRTTAPEILTALEHKLTDTAEHHDPDFLTRLARRWAEALDPDGHEPSDEELRHTLGAFLRRSKHGLNHLEIFATQDQYEHLLTVMNTATNPRTKTTSGTDRGTGDGAATDSDHDTLDRRSRPQKLLDGLISACRAALTTGTLPTAGGHRPQITATIDYRHLLDSLTDKTTGTANTAPGTGNYTFTGPVPAAVLRKLACDADILPAVLGGGGQILDIGRAGRLFPPGIRKALTARDQGCAFPGCTIPAPWCETHHITYWSHGGPTNADNGTLLCSHHHHVIHKEQWTIHLRAGVPWFIPPPHIDPHQQPRQNHYFRC